MVSFTFHNVSIKSPMIENKLLRTITALHSTMSLLNRVPELAAAYDEETLHSTMSLLNPDLQIGPMSRKSTN